MCVHIALFFLMNFIAIKYLVKFLIILFVGDHKRIFVHLLQCLEYPENWHNLHYHFSESKDHLQVAES